MITFPDIPESAFHSVVTIDNSSGIKLPIQKNVLQSFVSLIEQEKNVSFSLLELVYVDEDNIVEINQEYLGRDYITDIITFRYDENPDNSAIEGTLFCCAPRIKEQSIQEDTTETQEFYRIFVHGLLHLCGYSDQTQEEKSEMTRMENYFLERSNI